MTRSALRRGDVRAVVLLAIVTVAAAGVLFARGAAEPSGTESSATSTSTSASLAPSRATTALWVGDSYTAGVGRIDNASYARIVCLRMGWACNVDAEGSTGFLDDGAAEYQGVTSRLPARLDFDKATFDADAIIVDAGRNDLEVPFDVLIGAIDDYVSDLREGWPDARIVIIVPTFMSPEKYDNYDELVAGIDAIAAKVGGQVLDPVARGWYANVDIPSMQIEDRVHPNAVGNAYLAGVLERDLRELGLGDLTAPEGPQ
ncbi:SGNH/GDSL hydrolase family protein [Rhodococcus sp. BP-149]|jgi:lysophospholipase L1-like esterase|uniref:SGNH/GDSL hydrolase family protein n=1 Tax=unclassified Rhodococcus (in: high G+C Gram-positive bacteria) TaxID=192944 RepID=UPI001C9B61EA|nr:MULTISPECIES: SGNH/GDSL hydrolase family protein [unclassified Rhodococcus (in: high G+C Gram-positive bacteria)]MBY6686525.1 SGNH/GDSL hydrolase family protein [Rhodococcus sp. BP-288]MBY6695235.1 SGNH/GDSL hydrolase family protein [Rhodococcus sp. BP-188]MBY6700017.1 SGNH/GDSL hydrolase family protein [Rhodococcus sp. BP-285]MBY6704960.1 SGNH/GDSL hydrolase family protein [Rhodococcus sp. BP-283]MBY6713142.1 SGNH/GDSL hydrolase family protein [Rhodococcus sp. BP-160]